MGKLFNLARMSTATTGTGTITLGSAVTGYLTFAQAGVANSDVVSYGIVDGNSREVGTGTYTTSGTTLTRTVTNSTNSNNAIDLSGSAEVFITPVAADIPVGYGTVASGSAIAITGSGTYLLTGTTSVNTMTGGSVGRTVTLVASGQSAGVCVVLNHATSTNNLSLRDSANLGIYAGESVTFMFDGAKWIEVARDLRKVLAYNFAEPSGTISATSAATAQTLATASSVTFDGSTPVVITLYLYQWATGSTGSSSVFANLYDDSTPKQRVAYLSNGTDAYQQGQTLFTQVRLTPTAAARAYSIRAWRATSNGEWNTTDNPSATTDSGQGFIRIERDI